MTRCICRPGDPEGWYREDCPTHGREAEVYSDAEIGGLGSGPRYPAVGFLPDPCGAETRARYSWGGDEWLTCDRHAGHDGEHEDEYSGYKWSDQRPTH